MILFICGIVAAMFGLASLGGSVVKVALKDASGAHATEMNAIGWFILAVLLLK